MPTKKLLPILLPAVVVAMSQSVYAADAAGGRKLAEKWCAKCHNIEKGAPFKLHPPSFASIAVYLSEEDIRDRMVRKIVLPHTDSVTSPRTEMHNIVKSALSPGGVRDLVAYITSLEVK